MKETFMHFIGEVKRERERERGERERKWKIETYQLSERSRTWSALSNNNLYPTRVFVAIWSKFN